MADTKPSESPGPFDVGTVRELVELMDKFDLSEVDLNDGDQRIRLRRGGKLVPATPTAFSMSLPNSVGGRAAIGNIGNDTSDARGPDEEAARNQERTGWHVLREAGPG